MTTAWRFWPDRPAYRIALSSPGPWRGVLGVNAAFERQPFTDTFAPSERLVARIGFARWETSFLRWYGAAGIERWRGHRASGSMTGGVRVTSPASRVDASLDAATWLGSSSFATVHATGALRTSAIREGTVLLARGTLGAVSAHSPPDLWLAGDTGHIRPTLLRAHPLVQNGRLKVDQLGRRLAAVTIEAQRWIRHGPAVFAPAVFMDVARIGRRAAGSGRVDTDLGLGVRIGTPGIGGTLRLDVARGLRDGASAFTLVYEP